MAGREGKLTMNNLSPGGKFSGPFLLILLLSLGLVAVTTIFLKPAGAQTSVVQPIGTLINTWSVTQANDIAKLFDNSIIIGTTDPFGGNVAVTQIDPTRTQHFVRVSNTSVYPNYLGGWIMRPQSLRGLTPQQIADRFALPNGTPPTYILNVEVPPSPQPPDKKYGLLTGIAGPIWSPGFYWGQGGAEQIRIIKGGTSGGGYDFTDYSTFIPAESYQHIQPLGKWALLYGPRVNCVNAKIMAVYLDKFVPQPYSDLENVYTVLDYLNWDGYGPEPLKAALRQLTPERYDAFNAVGLRANLLFGDALMQRSQTLRLGLAETSGLSEKFSDSLGQIAKLAYVSSFSDPRMVSPGMLPSQFRRDGLGLWAWGVGEFGNQSNYGDRTGFRYRTGGFVAGVDWQARPNLVLGFGASYLGTRLNWNNDGGAGDVNYAKFALYGTYYISRFFIDGVFSGGVNWTTANRRIVFPYVPGGFPDSMTRVNRSAASSQTGHDLALQLRGGVNLPVAGWQLTPMAGLGYFYINQDAFQEYGAESLNLNVWGNGASTLRSQLGARLGRTFTTATGKKITPEVQVSWAHEFPLDQRVIMANLMNLGGGFGAQGFNGQTDSLLVGGGVIARLADRLALSGRYGTEIRRTFASHLVNLGLRFDFY